MATVNDEISFNSGGWSSEGFSYRVKSITNGVVLLNLYNGGWWSSPHAIQFDTATGIWSDPTTNQTPEVFSTTLNGTRSTSLTYPSGIFGWDSFTDTTHQFSFTPPSWADEPSGPTVTQTRTTHTGIVLAATGFTIRNPSPGIFYEKTGVGKFKIKFHDLNSPTTYGLKIIYTTTSGTLGDTQTITSASGDIELEYEGTSTSNTPVNGPITAQIVGHTVTIGGITYSPGTVFKTFTYVETGPYTASFSPDFGLPGQSITVSIADTNPYPDSDTPTQFEQSPGTDLISMPMTAANNYSNTVVGAFTSQHGLYKIYNGSTVLATANYDTNYVAPSTTSNGGGRPDRYPLIMTNLFNRNRSLYSIGMTHKDDNLFL